jgi:hypothetical protein
MRHMTTVAACAALAATLSLSCKPEAKASPARTGAEAPAGHYCNMGVFTPASLARFKELISKMVASVTTARELENGYVFSFSGQAREAGEWLDDARLCCSTLHYEVAFDPNAGPATLAITGSPGAKEFVREEFAPFFEKERPR